MRAHIVYPHSRSRLAAPWSIGNELAKLFSGCGYDVSQYDWTDEYPRGPIGPNDVVIGHPPDIGENAFTRMLESQARIRIAIAPWNGAPDYTARLAAVESRCDLVLAICGPYWADRLPSGWRPLDMFSALGVCSPRLREWNPPGERKVLYIGCTLPCKGTGQLAPIASEMCVGHIGHGRIPGAVEHGYLPIEAAETQRLIMDYDFVVAPGINDANPTTVLEGLTLGLIPISAPTAGWSSSVSVVTTDLRGTLGVMQTASSVYLGLLQSRLLDSARQYTPEAFRDSILAHIKSANLLL